MALFGAAVGVAHIPPIVARKKMPFLTVQSKKYLKTFLMKYSVLEGKKKEAIYPLVDLHKSFRSFRMLKIEL